MSTWDPVQGGGLPGSDHPVEVTVEKAYFGYDGQYNNGETLVFILEGLCDEAENGTIHQLYSIGNGWETEDGTMVTGRDAFVESTNYVRFFLAAIEAGAGDVVTKRGTPDVAAIWEGLRFSMQRKSFEMEIRGEKRKNEVLVPIEFLGEVGDGKAKPASKPTTSTATGSSSAASSGSSADKALRAKLKALAKKCDDHDDFIAKATEQYPEVEENAELFDAVLDESQIWAEAH